MAAGYSGTEIGIFREQLPLTDDNEFYWDDLVGLHVVTLDGTELGKVDHLIETGSNDVLVIRGEREYLVPFIQGQVIKAVDLAGRRIRVDWDPDF
jgi:16S rRNA processing protein RimM